MEQENAASAVGVEMRELDRATASLLCCTSWTHYTLCPQVSQTLFGYNLTIATAT